MKRLLFTLITAVLAVVSCHPEEVVERKLQPEWYPAMVQAYLDKVEYHGFDRSAAYVTFHFDGGLDIVVPGSDMALDECPSGKPAIIAWDEKDQWLVDGVPTGVYKEMDMTNQDALPLYLYLIGNDLHMRLSNGHDLIYTFVDPVTKGNIPVIYLYTKNKAAITSKETYVEGSIRISNPDLKFNGAESFEAPMKIRGRGNSTWGMPKKPWKIKLEEKARLFDMSTDKEWCLLANYCDKSLLRNMTAMEISRRLGFKWTPRMVPVEVYLNDSYQGEYNFCEHKKVSSERVNIDLDRGDILFELEQNLDEPVSWTTDHGAPVMFSEPSEPTAEQVTYAKKYFKDFETALWNKDFKTVYEMIDKESFVNNFIIQELTKNVDGNLRKSTFITLEKGGKLEMYHVWDFDITMGNCDYYGDGKQPWEGWWIKDNGALGRNHGWYYRLFMDPEFAKAVKLRWNEVYPQLETIPDYIKVQKAVLKDAPARNFNKWKILNSYVWPNYKVTGSYDAEVEWLLECYTKRLKWLNTQINAL